MCGFPKLQLLDVWCSKVFTDRNCTELFSCKNGKPTYEHTHIYIFLPTVFKLENIPVYKAAVLIFEKNDTENSML